MLIIRHNLCGYHGPKELFKWLRGGKIIQCPRCGLKFKRPEPPSTHELELRIFLVKESFKPTTMRGE